jgi:hypothetical protein
MRLVRLMMLLLAFFGFQSVARAEGLTKLIVPKLQELQFWTLCNAAFQDRLPLRWTTYESIRWGLSPFAEFLPPEDFLRELRLHQVRNRSIIARNRDAEMPSWRAGVPAFIVEPGIWYFDPESSVHKMNFQVGIDALPGVPAELKARETCNASLGRL